MKMTENRGRDDLSTISQEPVSYEGVARGETVRTVGEHFGGETRLRQGCEGTGSGIHAGHADGKDRDAYGGVDEVCRNEREVQECRLTTETQTYEVSQGCELFAGQ